MLMQLLQSLGMSPGKDYLENISESAPDSSNPEEMNQFIQDLVMNVSGGGVGGTIKTGTKAAFDVSKNTLLKKFFEKYRGKPYPRKPITTRKGWTSEDLGGLSKITKGKMYNYKSPLGEAVSGSRPDFQDLAEDAMETIKLGGSGKTPFPTLFKRIIDRNPEFWNLSRSQSNQLVRGLEKGDDISKIIKKYEKVNR